MVSNLLEEPAAAIFGVVNDHTTLKMYVPNDHTNLKMYVPNDHTTLKMYVPNDHTNLKMYVPKPNCIASHPGFIKIACLF